MKSIKQWQKEIHDNAMAHGWWTPPRSIPVTLCLIHSEISEALEAYRNTDEDNFREEMADIAIRLFDACEAYDVDLEAEIEKKHAINIKRPYRHGGKTC